MKLHITGSLVLIAALASGCVVGRRTVGLEVPKIPASETTKGQAVVLAVDDARAFQNRPKDPSVPSIDGDVASLTPAAKGQMIGRQRNTYGKAMGDIALPADQNVTQQVRRLVEAALEGRGFSVTNDVNAPTSVSVTIDQFWAWGTPGMWSLSFEARVQCALTVKSGGKETKILVQGYGNNQGQVAKNENWKKAYDIAYGDFITKLEAELRRAGY